MDEAVDQAAGALPIYHFCPEYADDKRLLGTGHNSLACVTTVPSSSAP